MSVLSKFLKFFGEEPPSSPLIDKLIIALNSIFKDKNDEVVMIIENYIKGENGLKPTSESKGVNLSITQYALFAKMDAKQRVATLFILLDKEIISNLLSKLCFEIVVEISNAINEIKHIQRAIATAILEEFYVMVHSSKLIAIKGDKYLNELLQKTFNKEEIKEILNRISNQIKNKNKLKYLINFDSLALSKFLANEHPQAVALILAHLSDEKAAKIISCFSQKQRVEIIIKIANLTAVSSDLIMEIFKLVENRLIEQQNSFINIEGRKKATKILSYIGQNSSKELLNDIRKVDFNLASSLNDNIFTFDDIIKLNGNELRELLLIVDKRELAIALKGAVDEIKEKFLILMDKKSQEKFYEKMFFLGAVKLKEINEAKKYIVKQIYKLSELGIIYLRK